MVGGLFFIFSVTIMPVLDRQPAATAVAVMRSINRVIVAPAFLIVFLGTAVAGVVAVVLEPSDVLVDVGVALYVVGVIVLTRAVNIPLNDALEAATSAPGEAWRAFLPRWMVGNHLRGVASVVASALLTVAA